MKLTSVTAALFTVVFTVPAWSATVNVTGGEVFVDQGSGYRPVSNTHSVKPGDIVMAKVGGKAEVVYEDGCRQTVDVGAVVVVGQSSPCAANATGDTTLYWVGGLAVAAGVGIAIALSGDDSKSASAE